jgi:hypothetical protein
MTRPHSADGMHHFFFWKKHTQTKKSFFFLLDVTAVVLLGQTPHSSVLKGQTWNVARNLW